MTNQLPKSILPEQAETNSQVEKLWNTINMGKSKKPEQGDRNLSVSWSKLKEQVEPGVGQEGRNQAPWPSHILQSRGQRAQTLEADQLPENSLTSSPLPPPPLYGGAPSRWKGLKVIMNMLSFQCLPHKCLISAFCYNSCPLGSSIKHRLKTLKLTAT